MASQETVIRVVSHACALVEHGSVGLLTDPWWSESIFNCSWELLQGTVEVGDVLTDVTHVYVSHEHPDHFHVPTIRRIHSFISPIFLLCPTADRRLEKWFEREGLQYCLVGRNGVRLSDELNFHVFANGLYDSWSVLSTPTGAIVNLNDAKPTSRELSAVRRRFGPVSVLLTQFGFAEWPGSCDDTAKIAQTRARYLGKLSKQVQQLKPSYVIPFASFVKFSHEENEWANLHQVSILEAADCIHKSGSIPLVVAPNEATVVLKNMTPLDIAEVEKLNMRGIESWNTIRIHAMARPTKRSGNFVPLEDIATMVADFGKNLHRVNNRLLLWLAQQIFGVCGPVNILLVDHPFQPAIMIDPLRGIVTPCPHQTADVSMNSAALRGIFSTEFGADQIVVMMRFQSFNAEGATKLHKAFSIQTLNRCGIFFSFRRMTSASSIRLFARAIRQYLLWRFDRTKGKDDE